MRYFGETFKDKVHTDFFSLSSLSSPLFLRSLGDIFLYFILNHDYSSAFSRLPPTWHYYYTDSLFHHYLNLIIITHLPIHQINVTLLYSSSH